jgi:hypothetical protein
MTLKGKFWENLSFSLESLTVWGEKGVDDKMPALGFPMAAMAWLH